MTTLHSNAAPTTADELDGLVAGAHVAYEAARDVTPVERATWLESIANALEAHGDELKALADAETNLGQGRLTGELKRTIFQVRIFAQEIVAGEHLGATIDHADGDWGMGPRPDIRRVNVPLGVVGVFGASNFPFAFSVMGGDSVSALAAGCAVVHKIHGAHVQLGLRTGEIVVAALAEAGAPEGLFSVVTGRDAGTALVDHPLIRAIGFTGSTAGGRALFDRANARPTPIPFYGELGSINPVVVTPGAWEARRDEILSQYAGSFTMGMGQFCTKPGLLLVPGAEASTLAPALSEALEGANLHPLLSPGLREGFDSALAGLSASTAVEVIVAGDDGAAPRPTVLATTVAALRSDASALHEEVFGPASVIITYDGEEELVEVLEKLEGQLTATLQAEEHEDVSAVTALLEERSGRVLWNGWPTGVTVSYAQVHGGPYPATTNSATTSVGTAAIDRFLRPVALQSFPDAKLPPALQESNPWGIARRVDGVWQRPSLVD